MINPLFRESRLAGLRFGAAKLLCLSSLRQVVAGNSHAVPATDYLWVTIGTQVGALNVGAEPKMPGIISDEQSKIRPFSVVAR